MTDQERIAELVAAIEQMTDHAKEFHACKNIRAWAADENVATKNNIIAIGKKALEKANAQ